jgi:hypothetical protein
LVLHIVGFPGRQHCTGDLFDVLSDTAQETFHLVAGSMYRGDRDLSPLVEIVIIGLGNGYPIALMEPFGERFDHATLFLEAAPGGYVELEYRNCDDHLLSYSSVPCSVSNETSTGGDSLRLAVSRTLPRVAQNRL